MIPDLGRTIALERLSHGRDAEAQLERVGQAPGQYLAARPVHHRDQGQKAPLQRDVGDIRAPHVVRPRDRQVAQQGGRDPVSRVRLRRPGALVRSLPVEIIPPEGGEAGQPTARSTAPAAPSARAEGAGDASPCRASRRPPRAPSPQCLRPPPACCRGCAWVRAPGRATPA